MRARLPAAGVVLAVLLLGLTGTQPDRGRAQTPSGVVWGEPVNLSKSEKASDSPAIAADPSGMVHVVWAENLTENGSYTNMLMYTRWDGTAWSEPNDILMSPEGSSAYAQSPKMAYTPDGRLHVIWTGGWGGSIYYSSARADQAGNTNAWSRPILVNENRANGTSPSLAVGADGAVHVAYVTYTGEEQGVYYARSNDGGETWTKAEIIEGSTLVTNTMLSGLQLAVADSGTLHVAWGWATLPDSYPPKGLYYARSTDGGASWTKPDELRGPFGAPAFATRGDDIVHMVWSGTNQQRYKLHRWSATSGATWSETNRAMDPGGFQGSAGLALDSAGVLHLVTASSHKTLGEGVYHSAWNGASWTPAESVMKVGVTMQNQGTAALVATGGNRLHAVFMNPVADASSQGYQFDIFYVGGRTGAPRVEPQPLPTQVPTATPIPTRTPRPEPTPKTTQTRATAASEAGGPVGGGLPWWAGIVPAALLIAGVVVWEAGRRR